MAYSHSRNGRRYFGDVTPAPPAAPPVIRKYIAAVDVPTKLENVPAGARFLSAEVEFEAMHGPVRTVMHPRLLLWALVRPDNAIDGPRTVRPVEDEQPLDFLSASVAGYSFVATLRLENSAFHVFVGDRE